MSLRQMELAINRKGIDKPTAYFHKFYPPSAGSGFPLLDPKMPMGSEIQRLRSILEKIVGEKNKLAYYDIAIPAEDVVEAKRLCPKDHKVQDLLDGYLRNSLGNQWPLVQRAIAAAMELSE